MLIKSSFEAITAERCFFLRSLAGDLDFRFTGPDEGESGDSDVDGEVRRGKVDCSSTRLRADSGTRRKVPCSTRLDARALGWVLLGPGLEICGPSLFCSPRAAAAQESKVDRLALRAASWSTDTLWLGAIILYGE